jgi:MinD superfamily P-loop ATPase
MIIAIASGKGGTGKTTVAVNMALSLGSIQLLDCDVEEPNAHILLHPEIHETQPIYSLIPRIVEERCNFCGKCAEFCAFNALFVAPNITMTFSELCHSCGGCSIVCPTNAILEEQKEIATIIKGNVGNIELVYGELKVGEPMPVPVIKAVKKHLREDLTVLIDAPPGTACSLVSSVYQSNYCILVTEPTPFGLHDLKITVQVLRDLKVPMGLIINRSGIGDTKIYDYCSEENLPILLEIPFSKKIAELYSKGIPFVKKMPEWKERFQQLFKQIEQRVKS